MCTIGSRRRVLDVAVARADGCYKNHSAAQRGESCRLASGEQPGGLRRHRMGNARGGAGPAAVAVVRGAGLGMYLEVQTSHLLARLEVGLEETESSACAPVHLCVCTSVCAFSCAFPP